MTVIGQSRRQAVQFNLRCSEMLHNADLIEKVPTKLFELNAYRYDQVSISLIVSRVAAVTDGRMRIP